jgi:hypothetical protein
MVTPGMASLVSASCKIPLMMIESAFTLITNVKKKMISDDIFILKYRHK